MGRNCLGLIIFFYFSLFLGGIGFAKSKYNDISENVYLVEVLDIIDGDTFWAEISYSPTLSERINIRIKGVDTPEKLGSAKCDGEKVLGRKASEFLGVLFSSSIDKGKKVFISGVDKDKYGGRLVADVYISEGVGLKGRALSVADELLKSGLAVAYDGGAKSGDWCE